ncbi:hypothetical protein V8J88_03695 [Massilia sp. W12]|uniref:hypothetical protein n=1 Tax=Massilia sp. W12 TaxID=3126507 RepID=UPI0030CDEA41
MKKIVMLLAALGCQSLSVAYGADLYAGNGGVKIGVDGNGNGGRSVAWDGVLEVNDNEVVRVDSMDICYVRIWHEAYAKDMTPNTTAVLRSLSKHGAWQIVPHVSAQGMLQPTVYGAMIRKGKNLVEIMLDPDHILAESNENNNKKSFSLNYQGNKCDVRGPGATPTPTPTATPIPTATPTPTATPIPTATPTPSATPNPRPTATPAPNPPSPSPTPTPTPPKNNPGRADLQIDTLNTRIANILIPAKDTLLELPPGSARMQADGKCGFEIVFAEYNAGKGDAGPALSRIWRDRLSILDLPRQGLQANYITASGAMILLPPGRSRLLWEVDSNKQVQEDSESNNQISFDVMVRDTCQPSATPTPTPAPSPVPTPGASPTPAPSPVPTPGVSPTPTATPAPQPSPVPGKPARPVESPVTADLRLIGGLTLGPRALAWGGEYALSAADLTPGRGCRLPLRFNVENAGQAPAFAFYARVSFGNGQSVEIGPFNQPPGSKSEMAATLTLPHYTSGLTLLLDSRNQVVEAEKRNNVGAIRLNVGALCKPLK